MDPLALLTRSSKTVRRRPNAHATALPSKGATDNPRLYSSSDPTSSATRKRKRGQDALSQDAEDGPEINFFQPSAVQPADAAKEDEPDADEDQVEDQTPVEPMEMSERRRIFKEHKLKITLLATPDIEPAGRSKKKKKSGAGEDKPKPKTAQQIHPEPVVDFAGLRSRYGLSRALSGNIREQGFKLATEVQMASLPLLLGGVDDVEAGPQDKSRDAAAVDLLTVAPTGSGKTLAFLIPLLQSLSGRDAAADQKGPRAVILAPTKELVNQIVNEARKLAVGMGLNISNSRKGVDLGLEESSDSKDIPDVVVSTPLALVHALQPSSAEANEEDATARDTPVQPLSSVRHLILDEADVLLDPLFKPHVDTVWTNLPHPLLRVSLWSATISSSIEASIISTILARRATPAPLVRLVVGLKDSAVPNITHTLTYCATERGKLLALRDLLVPKSSASPLRPPLLVFTQTIPRATALHQELKYDIPPAAGGSARIAALHSALPDRARDRILAGFRRGDIWVLITTDLLARGLDFRGVNAVVNYDVPTSAAGYVHRVGRTGRAGREGGVAVTLYTKEDIRFVKVVANAIAGAERGRGEGERGVQRWLLDALPDVGKKDRRELKARGVEERRAGKRESRITTKSGFVRREENRRRDMVRAAKSGAGRAETHDDADKEDVFSGFDD